VQRKGRLFFEKIFNEVPGIHDGLRLSLSLLRHSQTVQDFGSSRRRRVPDAVVDVSADFDPDLVRGHSSKSRGVAFAAKCTTRCRPDPAICGTRKGMKISKRLAPIRQLSNRHRERGYVGRRDTPK